jgi:DNA helicase HerA-like ATPase
MEILIERVVKPQAKRGKLKLLLIDEANRFFPAGLRSPYFAGEMIDFNRHWGLTVVTVCRRPVQINTTLVELSDYQIIFNLTGKNDLDYLDSLCQGFGDKVVDLPNYHFVIRHGKSIHLCSPIPLGRLDKETREVQ